MPARSGFRVNGEQIESIQSPNALVEYIVVLSLDPSGNNCSLVQAEGTCPLSENEYSFTLRYITSMQLLMTEAYEVAYWNVSLVRLTRSNGCRRSFEVLLSFCIKTLSVFSMEKALVKLVHTPQVTKL